MLRLRRSRQAPAGCRLRRQYRAMARAGAFCLAYTPAYPERKTVSTVKITPYPSNLPPQPNGPRWG